MKHLTRLTPAETLLVRHGEYTDVKDVLKFTLMDLLFRQVLTIEDAQDKAYPNDDARMIKYVSTGKKFSGYAARDHERVFLSPFLKSNGLHLLFQNLIKVGYENAGPSRKILRLLKKQEPLRMVFRRSLFQWLTGSFSYTPTGRRLLFEIESEIETLEKELPELMKWDRARALSIMQAIGGNIFLLKGIDFELAHQIDKALWKESNTEAESASGCWVFFDTYYYHFDSACGAHSSHHSHDAYDSGCTGDNGCSGDSGDSGCGGDSGCSSSD